MDWISILGIIFGVGGLGTSIVMGIMNRRVTRAQARQIDAQSKQTDALANSTNADYADKIIEQADKRVAQYEKDADDARSDRDAIRKERDEWQAEAKGQRKAKQEWRCKYEEAVSRNHVLELALKDKEAQIVEAKWHECRRSDQECNRRIPPRRPADTNDK